MAALALLAACGTAREGFRAPAREGFLERPGASLYWRAVGRGEPVLVLHGGPLLDHGYLAPHLDALAGEGLEMVYYDQRACGRTVLHDDTAGMSLAGFVRDIEALRVHRGHERWTLLGHSWGGLLAQAYAAAHPDRVERLVLVSSLPPSAEGRAAAEAAERARLRLPDSADAAGRALALRLAADSAEAAALRATPAYAAGDDETIEALMRIASRGQMADPALLGRLHLDLPEDVAERAKAFAGLAPDLAGYAFTRDLERVRAPALVLYGEVEPLAQVGGPALFEALSAPGSRWVLLPDCGHFAFLEQPVAFRREVLEFLGR